MWPFLIVLVFFGPYAHGIDICSRVAVINFQEVLVDVNNDQKGEGLRHYLDRDETARHYLDLYQEGTKIKWQNTVMGPLSAGLIISGLTLKNDKTKNSFLVTGTVLMLVNFLVAGTLRKANEEHLHRAIQEYNKRHNPKIHFLPAGPSPPSPSFSFVLEKSWRF